MNLAQFQYFHFLRPEWFYALVPIFLLFIWMLLQKHKSDAWENFCDAELLQHFMVKKGQVSSRYPLFFILSAWLIAVFCLAGPTWNKVKAPIFTQQNALVILLDLSLSMNAQDLKPSRLERAKHKVIDLLTLRQEGQTALMVYAGDTHIVSPLTPDTKTILSFVPVLDTSLMPMLGSDLKQALSKAKKLFTNTGFHQGQIILLTDGIQNTQLNEVKESIKQLNLSGYKLSIIGVGTKSGSPIPNLQTQGFIKDNLGNIVLSKLDPNKLAELSQLGGGDYYDIQVSDQDIKSITQNSRLRQKLTQNKQNKQFQQQWEDMGAWFSLALLPIGLLMFRQGWLLLILIIIMPIPYQPAYSMEWKDLWLRADQQGSLSFEQGKHEQAANEFNDPLWKASALYKAGKYQQAADQFAQVDNIEANYNLANSLSHLKKFDAALAAYNKVLAKDPNHKDSLKNKTLIEDFLKQQKQDKNNDSDKKNNDQKNQDKKDQEKDGSKKDQQQQESDKDQQGQQQDSQDADKQEAQKAEQQDRQEQKETDKKKEQEALDKQKQAMKDKDKDHQEQEKQVPQQAQEEKNKTAKDKETKASLFSQLDDEQQQSMQQYLNQIQDDPAYLLRRKFYLNSLRKQQREEEESKQLNSNQKTQAQQSW